MSKPTLINNDITKSKQKQLLSQKDLNEIKYKFKSNNSNAFRKSKGHVATLEDPTRPSITQSRTFKLLQETLDNGLNEKETVFYDNISNTRQTRRCSLTVNNNSNKSDVIINGVLAEKNEADTTSSLSSSSDVKSDNDESNVLKNNNEIDKKMYASRSNSLANSRNIFPKHVNINNHERSYQSNQNMPSKKDLHPNDESDFDEYSNSTENSTEFKSHNKL